MLLVWFFVSILLLCLRNLPLNKEIYPIYPVDRASLKYRHIRPPNFCLWYWPHKRGINIPNLNENPCCCCCYWFFFFFTLQPHNAHTHIHMHNEVVVNFYTFNFNFFYKNFFSSFLQKLFHFSVNVVAFFSIKHCNLENALFFKFNFNINFRFFPLQNLSLLIALIFNFVVIFLSFFFSC